MNFKKCSRIHSLDLNDHASKKFLFPKCVHLLKNVRIPKIVLIFKKLHDFSKNVPFLIYCSQVF